MTYAGRAICILKRACTSKGLPGQKSQLFLCNRGGQAGFCKIWGYIGVKYRDYIGTMEKKKMEATIEGWGTRTPAN